VRPQLEVLLYRKPFAVVQVIPPGVATATLSPGPATGTYAAFCNDGLTQYQANNGGCATDAVADPRLTLTCAGLGGGRDLVGRLAGRLTRGGGRAAPSPLGALTPPPAA
jgi:hypothetical protein